jgi:hypothetical protein
VKLTLLGCLLCLASCGDWDWRSPQIAIAEKKVRALINDPNAQFSEVQLTGDQSSGQTCGKATSANGDVRRFIVYIDGAPPALDDPQDSDAHDHFVSAWTNDCLNEGYKAP